MAMKKPSAAKRMKAAPTKAMGKKSPTKAMGKKSPAKKALVGKQKNLPPELKAKILASPAKMLKPSAMKMFKAAATKRMKK